MTDKQKDKFIAAQLKSGTFQKKVKNRFRKIAKEVFKPLVEKLNNKG